MNQIKILAKQTFQKHFLRTAGFITTFSLAGLLIKCVSFITAGSSFRAFPEIAMIRLVAYVLIVLIIYFDKDILSYISKKSYFDKICVIIFVCIIVECCIKR